MEGRRTDNGHVTVKTQISRDGDPEEPDLVASCDSVCTQLQSWIQALELGGLYIVVRGCCNWSICHHHHHHRQRRRSFLVRLLRCDHRPV